MKEVFLAIVLLTVSAVSQTVPVTQGYLDDSVKAFREVRELRAALLAAEDLRTTLFAVGAAKDDVIKAKDDLIKAKEDEIKAKDGTIAVKDAQIENYRKLKCDKTTWFFVIKNVRCH